MKNQDNINKIDRIAIAGVTGYTGLELLSILNRHPKAEICQILANNTVDMQIHDVASRFKQIDHLILPLGELNVENIDVIFCALPHGFSQEIVAKAYRQNSKLVIIDLSADFRSKDKNVYQKYFKTKHNHADLLSRAVYGLSEVYRGEIRKKRLIANPGCYATGVLTALIPLIINNKFAFKDIIINAYSGVTGAGKKITKSNIYSEVNESISNYSQKFHHHLAEITQELSIASHSTKYSDTIFTPHLAPMQRGIFIDIYLRFDQEKYTSKSILTDITQTWQKFYKLSPFINVFEPNTCLHSKDVCYTNNVNLAVSDLNHSSYVVVNSTLDNLVKGAAGQAVQNYNIHFDYDEKLGLL